MDKKLMQALKSLRMNKRVMGIKMDGSAGMTKREQELRQNAADLRNEAKAFMDEGKQEEAKAKLADAKAAKSELDNFLALQKDFEGLGSAPAPKANGGQMPPTPKDPEENPKAEYKGLFFKAIRGKSLTSDEMGVMDQYKARLSSKEGEDGGYIIPEDVQTKINKLRGAEDDLKQYVNVIPVSTNKGSRTLERRAEQTPFAPLSEYGDPNAMGEIASPKFDRVSYAIEDYAGFLPVYNSLLDDSDQALEDYLIDWIGKKGKATDNHFILEVLEAFDKTVFDDYTGIKTALNVTLDSVFLATTKIYTNQDGYNYLDKLEDNDGRPLLQPDPTDATKKLLHGYRIVVFSNKTIKTTEVTNLAPIIIGDIKEAVNYYDRNQLSIDMTKVGGDAWRSNTTEFRAIMRLDTGAWDKEAVVYGQIDVTPVPVA